jgi:hypothetical protein
MAPKVGSKKYNLQYSPETVEDAWGHLAVSVLLQAIEDTRKNRDPLKRAQAKAWLLSPAAAFLFDAVMDVNFDFRAWVLNDCPMMEFE